MRNGIIVLFSLMFLSSCSGTYQQYWQSLKIAYQSNQDIALTLEEVQQQPYDVAFIKQGDRAQIIAVLAYIENGHHKWVSADRAMLVMEKGRMIKTVGFENDLLATQYAFNPLTQSRDQLENSSWLASLDWSAGFYGEQVRSNFSTSQQETLTHFDRNLAVNTYTESVEYKGGTRGSEVFEWQNQYWFDAQTGQLLKSSQQLSPNSAPYTVLYASRIASIIKERNL